MHRDFLLQINHLCKYVQIYRQARHLVRCVRPTPNTPMADCYVSWFFVPLYQRNALSCDRARLEKMGISSHVFMIIICFAADECGGVWSVIF